MADAPKIEVNFDQAALHDLVSKWVLEQMSGEQREKVLQQAITYLMTPPESSSYNRNPPSPLQVAFNNSLTGVMHDVARKMVEEDPTVRESIQKLMGEALEGFLHTNWSDKKDSFVKAMADAFATVFSKSSYE